MAETKVAGADLAVTDVVAGYGTRTVLREVTARFPSGQLTAVLGPNGCGKSTLLRSISQLLPIESGSITLGGTELGSFKHKDRARRLAFLPQESIAPEGITVRRLVARGRFPHQSLLSTWSAGDTEAVEEAMTAAHIAKLADRPVAALSGGQRQRVWVAMALAQDTRHVLLDEPTTFLDVSHQYDLLRLLRRLVADGRTVVAILHDLNQAARFADHLVVLHRGRVVAEGAPDDVITADLMQRVFDLPSDVIPDPVSGRPLILPH